MICQVYQQFKNTTRTSGRKPVLDILGIQTNPLYQDMTVPLPTLSFTENATNISVVHKEYITKKIGSIPFVSITLASVNVDFGTSAFVAKVPET